MNARQYAISLLGEEFKQCSNIEVANSLIAGNYVNKPKFKNMTKSRASRLIRNLHRRVFKTTSKRKAKPTKKSSYKKQSAEFLKSWEWRTLRYEVIKEHGKRCMCCGASPDDGETVIHVDHIKPRSKYPELSLVKDNLQILCGVCNQGKGAWDETDFRNDQQEYCENEEHEIQMRLVDQAKLLQ